MTSASLPQPRFRASRTLRAIVVGLAVCCSAPVLADNLPDAQRFIKRGQYEQALEKVDAQLRETPDDAQARFLKGVIYTETDRTAEAIAIFTRLTEDYPEMPESYNNLAVLYARQNLYDKARMALEMAIQAHPTYATAYENLGDLHAKLASQAYAKAVQLDAGSKSANAKLALARDLIAKPGKKPAPAPAQTGNASSETSR